MNRVTTGILGLDELLDGGLVQGTTTLLSGRSGTGKTVFGLQFLYEGAKKQEEPGILVTLETRPALLYNEGLRFGWNLEELVKENKLVIIDAASSKAGLPTSEKYALRRGFDMTQLAEMIYGVVDEFGIRRLVLDSISGLAIRFNEPNTVRQELHRISSLLNELNVTSIFISERENPESHSRVGVEEYIAQGLILLSLAEDNDELHRSLLVWKMRQTAHSMKRHSFTIGQKGIKIQ